MASRITAPGDYEGWSQQQLVTRIQELELQLAQAEKITTTNIEAQNRATFTSFPIPSPGENASKQTPFRKPPKQPSKPFDASKYSTRLIALKFAYLGQKYNGFEHAKNNKTRLPTIEEEVWKALVKTRLIAPTPQSPEEKRDYDRITKKTYQAWDREGADVNWDGCEYSKCGRTDRGVSAFGQVIGIKVRSNRPLPKSTPISSPETSTVPEETIEKTNGDILEAEEDQGAEDQKPFDDLRDELPYIQLLNRVLPPDIRMYAWCPNPPPNFSARFSCKERRYKYFFTNPCFAPVPGSPALYTPAASSGSEDPMREGWLDIGAMKEACKHLIGLHDFRNLCKIDASKQLTNFNRRIFFADIEEVSPLTTPSFITHTLLQNPNNASDQPKIYSFTLHGSAFLWHQVRSIIAILFLVGQRLESPSLVQELLDVSKNPTRPKYEMASDAPLVLWDCIFPHADEVQSAEQREKGYEDRLEWVYAGDEGGFEAKGKANGTPVGRGKWGRGGVIDDVWEVWHGNKIDETLSGLLLDAIAAQGQSKLGDGSEEVAGGAMKGGPRVFDGADFGRAKGIYTPVMKRERNESVEVINEKYAKRKGWDGGQRQKAKEEVADE
ncbi:pseudouridylate synthase-like protein 3 [Aaosphaeria arxii CBS 175.79]|uniref:Pseudouridylate synthase-like protein 3 n=1 Tax=Aaosphaeria arxii CBS 175.79 TaxID=1450172 RepID=A0A6A5Y3W5_9PLEO|nr:pseudouridylate synthase-like protein 3 [Aaosphaeria arxii CBS 175.79]KAF2020265.1 pseudouridylate synthase-like protein 3 [Aaosphaeria arxii CBS 175.79]